MSERHVTVTGNLDYSGSLTSKKTMGSCIDDCREQVTNMLNQLDEVKTSNASTVLNTVANTTTPASRPQNKRQTGTLPRKLHEVFETAKGESSVTLDCCRMSIPQPGESKEKLKEANRSTKSFILHLN